MHCFKILILCLMFLPSYIFASDIFHFIEKNDVDKLRVSVNKKNVNEKNNDGITPLAFAAKKTFNPEIIDILVRAGAHINEPDKSGYTPLIIAIKNDYMRTNVILALIRNKADVNKPFVKPYDNEDGTTPLMFAVKDRDIDARIVQGLIDAGADVNAKNSVDAKAIFIAAKETGKSEIIDILLKAGADIEEKDKNGYTPLIIAVRNNFMRTGVVLSFIRNKADVNKPFVKPYDNEDGTTPLMFAVKDRDIDARIVQGLIDAGADVNAKNSVDAKAIFIAAKETGKSEIIDILLKAGANIEEKDKDGFTPLLIAVRNNFMRTGVVLSFIRNKADVNKPFIKPYDNKDGTTPLMFAVNDDDIDPRIVQGLVDAGADVNVKNTQGNTALIIAAKKTRKAEIIDILLKAGANIEEKDKDGLTPLMLAAKESYQRAWVAITLIQNKADVHAIHEKDLMTPLMYACSGTHKESKIVQALIDYGAKINAKNSDGQTALILNAKNGNGIDILKTLISNKADLNIKDKDGKTASDYLQKNPNISQKDLNKLR